jgi:predicted NBD/HSP70 family sugar kinase
MPTPRRTTSDVRRANCANVLYALRREGPISRQDIAARADISPATAANVVGQLLDEGVLTEAGQLPSNGGRPASLTQINPAYGAVIGVDVGETRVRLELFDLALERQLLVDCPVGEHDSTAEATVELVASGVDRLLAESGVARERLLGLGVGVPGIVEQGETLLVHAPSIGWSSVPLAALLEERVEVPATVDNGAKALGCAEAWFGAAGEDQDVIVCLIGTGVGASFIRHGQLYRGASASAGEWGHTTIVLDGDLCRCGAHGCLEAYVGAPAIARRWRESATSAADRDLSDEDAIERLAVQARAGRASAADVLRETARYLGAGISDLINLVNPDRIVIGGWVGLRLGPLLLPLVREQARDRALGPPFERAELDLCHLGPDAVALGAATIVVDRFFAAGGQREAATEGAGSAARVTRGRS